MSLVNNYLRSLLAVVALLVAVGCSSEVEVERYEDVTGELTIGTYYQEPLYFNTLIKNGYTLAFEYLYPNIEVDYAFAIEDFLNLRSDYASLTMDMDNLRNWLASDVAPDVVLLTYKEYTSLLDENVLVPLDSLMIEIGVADELEPSVLAALRHPVDGQMYGYAPAYNTEVIAYNRELFEAAGVGEPREGMTWEEIFTLAEAIAHSPSVDAVGFSYVRTSYPRFFDKLLEHYFYPRGLRIYDGETGKMTVTSDEWAEAMREIKQLYERGFFQQWARDLFAPPPEFKSFADGEVAMRLLSYNESFNIDFKPDFSYGVIPLPVYEQGFESGNGEIPYVFAIRNGSRNLANAKAFIHYLLSNDFKITEGLIPTRPSGQHLMVDSAFKELKIKPNPHVEYSPTSYIVFIHNDTRFFSLILGYGEQAFQDILTGRLDIPTALAEWEQRGNEHLQEAMQRAEKSTIF